MLGGGRKHKHYTAPYQACCQIPEGMVVYNYFFFCSFCFRVSHGLLSLLRNEDLLDLSDIKDGACSRTCNFATIQTGHLGESLVVNDGSNGE